VGAVIIIRADLAVEVDAQDWASEYGLECHEVGDDVCKSIELAVNEWVRERLGFVEASVTVIPVSEPKVSVDS
jgi:hypothetical protein